jgi:hypothetical protein
VFYLLGCLHCYIRDLLAEIVNSGIGCNLGGKMLNILAYADDIVIMCLLLGEDYSACLILCQHIYVI